MQDHGIQRGGAAQASFGESFYAAIAAFARGCMIESISP